MSSGRRGIQFAFIADLQACMDLSARHLLMRCLVGGKQGLRGTAGLVHLREHPLPLSSARLPGLLAVLDGGGLSDTSALERVEQGRRGLEAAVEPQILGGQKAFFRRVPQHRVEVVKIAERVQNRDGLFVAAEVAQR